MNGLSTVKVDLKNSIIDSVQNSSIQTSTATYSKYTL